MLRPLSIILSNIGSSSSRARSLSAPICCLQARAGVRSSDAARAQVGDKSCGVLGWQQQRRRHSSMCVCVHVSAYMCGDILICNSILIPIPVPITTPIPVCLYLYLCLHLHLYLFGGGGVSLCQSVPHFCWLGGENKEIIPLENGI